MRIDDSRNVDRVDFLHRLLDFNVQQLLSPYILLYPCACPTCNQILSLHRYHGLPSMLRLEYERNGNGKSYAR